MKLKFKHIFITIFSFSILSNISFSQINGKSTICVNEVSRYTANIGGTKKWEVKGGEIINNFDDFIDVKWTKASPKNLVKYKVHNHSTGVADSVVLSVNVKPTVTPYIDGKKNVCVGAIEAYAFSAIDPNYSPEWEIVNGSIETKLDDNTVQVKWHMLSGEGMVILKNNNTNICAGSDTLRVKIVAPPQLKIFGREQVCKDQYEVYSVKEIENDTYFWSSPKGQLWGDKQSTSVSVRWSEPGVDTISVTVHNMKTGCVRKYSKAVMVNNFVKAKLAPFKPICISGEKIKLTGGTPEGGTYSCGYLIKNNIFNVPFAGVGKHLITYTYTTPQGNCTSSDTATLAILAIPPKPLIFYESDILYTNINKGIQWFLGGEPIEGATGKTHEPTESGYYSVKAKNELDCFSPKSDSIYVDMSSVKETETSNIHIIKNIDNIIITSPKNMAKISVYNLIGTRIFSKEVNELNYEIDTKSMLKGVYFIKIICKDGTLFYKKLII